MQGCVYVITNPGMPGLVKIGFSMRSARDRAKEMYQSGSPYEYEVEYYVLVDRPGDREREVHQAMEQHRAAKEWFRCSPELAISVVREVIGDRAIEESFIRADRERATALQRKRSEERRERDLLELERTRQEAAIKKDYEKRFQDRFPEPKLAAWITGVFIAAIFLFGVLEVAKSDGHLFILSVSVGVVGGFVGQRWYKDNQCNSEAYRALLAERDDELASLGKIVVACPRCAQRLRFPAGRILEIVCPKCKTSFQYPD